MLQAPGKPVRVKLLEVERLADMSGTPGTVLDERLAIACLEGAIRPVRLQREGKSAIDLVTFLHGLKPAVGSRAG